MAKITYATKTALNPQPSIPAENKVTDADMNDIKAVVNKNTPTGSIQLFGGNTAPEGWLICDGSAVSRTTYSNLFSVIGTTYGSGDGSTTFNLPNLKGKVPVGLDSTDTSFDTLGETGGEKTHTLITDEMPSHTHRSGYKFKAPIGTSSEYDGWMYGNEMGQGTFSSGSAGGGQAHNNLQPYIVLNYIISY